MPSLNRVNLIALAALAALAAALSPGCNCSRENVKVSPKTLGERCQSDEECQSGLCDSIAPDPTVCMQPCGFGCGPLEICEPLHPDQEQKRYACVSDKAGLCQPCTTAKDCPYPGDACLTIDGKSFCGRDCSFKADPGTTPPPMCPTGFTCADGLRDASGVRNRQCGPVTGTCDCTPASVGQTRSCKVENSFGSCAGLEKCQVPEGFVGCTAKVPTKEICNGVDDNCDGQIDEDTQHEKHPGAGIPAQECGVGACYRTVPGCQDTQTPDAGIEAKIPDCVPGTPSPEICNGVDDDCDTNVDNGFPDKGQACTNGLGACQRPGKMVCASDGTKTICDAVPGPTAPETCNGIDDDCNGQIDDMGTISCGLGICTNTVPVCANAKLQTCAPDMTKAQPTDLPDDNLTDTNCDGIDGDISQAVFVDCSVASGGSGTMQAPTNSVAAALTIAAASSKTQILVATSLCAETITLKPGIGIYGGYDSAKSWTRSLGKPFTLLQTGPGGPVITGQGINAATALDSIIVIAADGAVPAGSSIAVQLVNSPAVTMAHLDIRAGAGGHGTDGAVGLSGNSAGPGSTGGAGQSSSSAGGGSGPGSSGCTTGGAGGTGGYDTGSGTTGGAGSGGATAGTGQRAGHCSSCGGCGGPTVGLTGGSGGTGAAGAAGGNGTGGGGAGTGSAGGFTSANGVAGGDGQNGASGGGGGGGGGGMSECCAGGFFCACANGCNADRGGGGGGGGGGGCGGKGGGAGGGGGASVGMLLVGSPATIRDSSIKTSLAGFGGNGAAGGLKGAGGGGGQGGSAADDAGGGGSGGAGGDGGNGGAGGGGGGGPSVGIYQVGGAATESNVSYTIGSGGAGGIGGAAGNTNGGTNGISQSVYTQ